ncbi:hypothetical protein TI03_07070, partial [Achromatium sp. WMS1]
MQPFGRMTAVAGCSLFGIMHLGYGTEMSLQRDFIVILPIATALLIAIWRTPNHSANLTNFLFGILFALVILIKPYHAIGLPVLVIYTCIDDGNNTLKTLIKPCIIRGGFALFGFLLVLTIPFLWLWQIEALSAFGDIFSSYTQLYAQISGDLKVRDTFSHVVYTLYKYTDHKKLGILMLASTFGTYMFVTRSKSIAAKHLSILLFLFCILHAISAGIGGKVWDYHMIPYMY